MPGALACRRAATRPLRIIVLTVIALATLAVGGVATGATGATSATSGPSGIRLTVPVHGVDPLTNVAFQFRPDRLKVSKVPGPTSDREAVVVAVGPTGRPAAVTDTQRLVIHGAGNYVIRELGPARAAVGLGDTVPPVLELGTVVWQGFSPDRRALAARLTLDAGIESARLPLRVDLTLHDRAGAVRALQPGAVSPVDGTVDVTLSNQTGSTRTLDVGRADAFPLAAALDRLRRAAAHPRVAVPPAAGTGLPRVIPGERVGVQSVDVVAPLRISGSITVPGGRPAVTGPGTTPIPHGVAVSGTLAAPVTFAVPVRAGQAVSLDLHVQPWPDPRTVQPPSPARSWRQWSSRPRTDRELTDATSMLVDAAAAAARAAEYSPYLQANAPGPDLSTFTYVTAPATATRRAVDVLHPHPLGITLTVLAVLAVVGNAAMLRRLF